MRTLFDPKYKSHRPHFEAHGFPYPYAVRSLTYRFDEDFDDTELSAFDQMLDHESQMYFGSYAKIVGPITLQIGGKTLDLRKAKEAFHLPAFIENDWVKIITCNASGILFVERLTPKIEKAFLNSREWRKLKLVFASSGGLPRQTLRRFLYRMVEKFRLPVYALTDCDTWGYFITSILSRGALAPHETCEYFAVKDLRWLGLRSGEFVEFAQIPENRKTVWDVRMKFLRKYPCFKSNSWQKEFDRFEAQSSKISLYQLLNIIKPSDFLKNYVASKIKNRDWLTVTTPMKVGTALEYRSPSF